MCSIRKTALIGAAAAMILAFGATSQSVGLIVFQTGFEYSGGAPTVGTDPSNLNGADGQVGTWSGTVPTGSGGDGGSELITFPTVGGSDTFMLLDRGTADATLIANFTKPVPLTTSTVSFEFGIRRSSGNHGKDVEIIGFDSSSAEAFHLIVTAVSGSGPAGERGRIAVVTGGGATTTYDLPTTSGNDADLDLPFTADGASAGRIALTLLPAAFTIDFGGASNAWVSDALLYNGTPTDLARIEYRAPGGGNNGVRSGYWLDDLAVNAIPEPSTLLVWSLLAGLGIGAGWRRRK